MITRLFVKEIGEKQGKYAFVEEQAIVPIVQGDNSSIFYDGENGYFISGDDEILEVKNDLKWLEVQDVQELLNIRPLTEELYKQYEAEAYDDDMYFMQGDNIYIIATDHNGYIDDNNLCYILNKNKIDITEKMHKVDTYATGGTGFWTYDNINGWYIEIIEYDCYSLYDEIDLSDYSEVESKHNYVAIYKNIYTNELLTLDNNGSFWAGESEKF